MSRRGRSSTCQGVQHTATLLVLAVLACACSIASCFVVSSPAAAFSRQHTDTAGTAARQQHAGGGTRSMSDSSAREVVRRQRSSCLRAAGVQGGEEGGQQSSAADGVVGAIFAATSAAALGGAAAAREPPPSLSSQSTAPARTEIPTDVAVVGAPQQVREKERAHGVRKQQQATKYIFTCFVRKNMSGFPVCIIYHGMFVCGAGAIWVGDVSKNDWSHGLLLDLLTAVHAEYVCFRGYVMSPRTRDSSLRVASARAFTSDGYSTEVSVVCLFFIYSSSYSAGAAGQR